MIRPALRFAGGLLDPFGRNPEFLESHPSLEIVDVTATAESTFGNGHAYFRKSPWVSSDILTLLRLGPVPAERGLVTADDPTATPSSGSATPRPRRV